MKYPMLIAALFVLWNTHALIGQNRDKIWYFGGNAGLDFNTSPPTLLVDGALVTLEGCASMADPTTGQALFYTDGERIYNRNHSLMLNGDSLLGHFSTTQAAVIVPQPGSTRYYFVVTLDEFGGSNGYRYSVVDMNLDNGLGGVTATKNQFLQGAGTEKLTATCHGNGTDYWILTHGQPNNHFYAYHVSATGINPVPVMSAVGAVHGLNPFGLPGAMELSPDGSRIAVATAHGAVLEVLDFDNTTGVVSNPITLPALGNEYGCAFSPDGSKVYFSSVDIPPYDVVQFDLSAGSTQDIIGSRFVVLQDSFGIESATMKLGPDGRIYVSRAGMYFLDVIEYPNLPASTCGYTFAGISLGSGYAMGGLPNNLNCAPPIFLDAELLAFTARAEAQNAVILNWKTSKTASSGEYLVQRSNDGAYFSTIGEVPVASGTTHPVALSYRDLTPHDGKNYYRLCTRNPDGTLTYSEVQLVRIDANQPLQVEIYPNPAREITHLSLEVSQAQTTPCEGKIISLTGQTVVSLHPGILPPGKHLFPIHLSELDAGMYTVEIRAGNQVQRMRLVHAP